MTYDADPNTIKIKLRDRTITVGDLVRAVGGDFKPKRTRRNARNHVVAVYETHPWVGFQDIERTDAAPWYIDLNFEESHALTFAHLQTLSELCGTRVINIGYGREEDDFSEYTPGDPSRFTIQVRER